MKLFLVSSARVLEEYKDTTYSRTHSTIDRNHETHDRVTQNTGANSHSPAETDVDHGRRCAAQVSAPPRSPRHEARRRGLLTNFPVRHCPGIGHPVGDIRAPVPCPLRRRDGVEISIGSAVRRGKAALLVTDCETEAAFLQAGHVTSDNGLVGGGDGGAILLIEGFIIVGCHDGRSRGGTTTLRQCEQEAAAGREEEKETSSPSDIKEVEGRDKTKTGRSAMASSNPVHCASSESRSLDYQGKGSRRSPNHVTSVPS